MKYIIALSLISAFAIVEWQFIATQQDFADHLKLIQTNQQDIGAFQDRLHAIEGRLSIQDDTRSVLYDLIQQTRSECVMKTDKKAKK